MGLLDLLVPARCAACGREGPPLCADCTGRLVPIREPLCARCGAPVAWPVGRCAECAGRRLAFAGARAAVAYEGVAVDLVRAWKEGNHRHVAGVAAGLVADRIARPHADVLTFVPAVRDRELWRGHNPARQLARELEAAWSLPLEPLVVRASAARRQRGLGLAERRANLRGAFRVTQRPPPCVVVVDDVYTSGATAAAVASALRREGACRVEIVTFARTLRHRLHVSRPGARAKVG